MLLRTFIFPCQSNYHTTMNSITSADCEEILLKEFKKLKHRFVKFQVVKLGSFLGFLGEYYQLEIVAEICGIVQLLHYFVKSLPTNEKEREIQIGQGFLKKEIRIYREVLNNFIDEKQVDFEDQWCPKFYLAKDDVLVLEDLASKGYKTLPFRYDFEQQHVEEALKMLARFHSRSFIHEMKNPEKTIGDEFREILLDKGFVACNPWLMHGFKVIEAVADKIKAFEMFPIKSEIQQKLNAFFTRMYEPEVDIIKILCHSDGWKNNLMFSFEDRDFERPNHCMLLDFQVAKYLPLPIDFLMLVTMNTRKGHREQMMEHYLNFYYEKLHLELAKHSIELGDKMNFEEFRESCEYFNLPALVYTAISKMITNISTEMYTKMSDKDYDDFMIHDRFQVVSQIMDSDSYYCEVITEAVEELIEYLSK